jgi:hypothetical protein
MHKDTAAKSFNAIRAIQAHFDQRDRIDDYVNGKSEEIPNMPTTCHGECLLGTRLHDKEGKHSNYNNLIDSICASCEKFHDAAFKVILLADLGKSDAAKAELRAGTLYCKASEELQLNLAELHTNFWKSAA